MKFLTRMLSAVALAVATIAVAGCVQMPTEKQGVADMRPSISFRTLDPASADARVLVDEIEAGRVGDYVEGKAALRVLPGTHLLRVVRGNEILLNEKVYLGDGVSRVFIVK
jgi:hypothetical protein